MLTWPSPNCQQCCCSQQPSLGGIYVISREGGTPQKLVSLGHAPTWSPDGNSLAFGTLPPGAHPFDEGHWFEIHRIDLRTKQVTLLPSTDNMMAPW